MTCTEQGCSGSYNKTLYSVRGSVKGTVRSMGGGIPPVDTDVTAYPVNAPFLRRTTQTNDLGEYDFNDLVSDNPPWRANNWALDFRPTTCPGPCRANVVLVAGTDRPLTDSSADSVEFSSSTQVTLDLVLWDPEPPDLRCDTCGKGPAGAPCSVGQPISVTTGNMYFDHTDITIPTLGTDFAFTRSYNSYHGYVGTGGVFGLGWHHSFERSLTASGGVISVRGADGTAAHYRNIDGDSDFEAWLPRNKETWIVPGPSGYARHFRTGGHETYDTAGRLTAVVDAFGIETALEYDGASGRLVGIHPPGGRSVTFAYNTQGRIESISGPGGLLVSYEYRPPSLDVLQRVTYADGRGYTFAYLTATSGQLKEIRDLSGRLLESHTYQGIKAETSEIADGIEKYTLDYSDPFSTVVTDALGNRTTYDITSRRGVKLVSRITGPCSSGCGGLGGQEVQEWTYNEDGWVTAYKDGNGRVTEYGYDTDGDFISMTEAVGTPLARTTMYTNDPGTGLRASRTVASVVNGGAEKVTLYEYDHGQLRLLTESGLLGDGKPYSYVTTWTYDQGKLMSVDGPRADVSDITSFGYDAATGDRTSVTVPHAGTTTYSDFTPLGQPQTVTDPNNVPTSYTYDARGRVRTSTIGGHTTTYTYSPTGKLERIDLPRGNSIHYDYDDYDRLEKIRDHLGNYVKYT